MSGGLDSIFSALHQNIQDGKLYEALMQYKSLFTRYSRRSFENGFAVLQDGVNQFSKQTDLNAYYGLLDFYLKFLQSHTSQITDSSIQPFNSLSQITISKEKVKILESIVSLVNNTSLEQQKVFITELGNAYMQIGDFMKSLNIFSNSIEDVIRLMKYSVEQTSNIIPIEVLYLLSVLKVLQSQTPSNARLIYQYINKEQQQVLATKEGHLAVIITILIMKVISQPTTKDEVKEAFEKVVEEFKPTIDQHKVHALINTIKSAHFVSEQTNVNPFASMMQSMMQQK
ncbi:Uncharacterized protein QTN25_009365 [Entamoeba marina]